MKKGISLHVRGDPEIGLESDAVVFGGTDDYAALRNKPRINGVELVGDLSLDAIGVGGGGGGVSGPFLSEDEAQDLIDSIFED